MRLVASNLAIQNLGCHSFKLARGTAHLNRPKRTIKRVLGGRIHQRAFEPQHYRPLGKSTNTAAATTEVHSPSRSPIADWVTFRVVTILSDTRHMSLRSS
jgi:hypothetical protein